MVVRRSKKKNKLRGHRSHGKGDTKNRRGSGCKGGKGRAGSHKHKFSKYYATFGLKRKLKSKIKKKTVNLEILENRIEELVKNGAAEKKDDVFVIDCKKAGIEKILGKGAITKKVQLLNVEVSAKAKEKIEKAGGSFEGSDEETAEE